MDMKLFVEFVLDAAGAALAVEAEFQLEAISRQQSLLYDINEPFRVLEVLNCCYRASTLCRRFHSCLLQLLPAAI